MENEINSDVITEESTPPPAKEKSKTPKRGFIDLLKAHGSDMALVFVKGETPDQQFCEDLAEEIEADEKGEPYKKLTVDEKTYAMVLKAWVSYYESEDGCDKHSMEVWRQGAAGRHIVLWPAHLVDQAPNDQTSFYRSLSNRLIEALRNDGANVQCALPTPRQDTYEIIVNGVRNGYQSTPDVNDLSDFFWNLREIAIDWAASRPDLPPSTVKQLRLVEDRNPDKSDRAYFDDLLMKRLSA